MSDLTVKIAQADPEVREHIEALRKGMAHLERNFSAMEQNFTIMVKVARYMNIENTRLRAQIAEMQGPPPGVWGSLKEGRPDE